LPESAEEFVVWLLRRTSETPGLALRYGGDGIADQTLQLFLARAARLHVRLDGLMLRAAELFSQQPLEFSR
jgi:hypothetical protein